MFLVRLSCCSLSSELSPISYQLDISDQQCVDFFIPKALVFPTFVRAKRTDS